MIRSDLFAVNKEDALEKMTEMLQKAGYVDDAAGFIADVMQRESLGCTGIGNYVAIPHGKSPSVSKVGIAIVKLQTDNENAMQHLKLLAQVAGKLGNDEVVEKLLNAGSVEEIKTIFE